MNPRRTQRSECGCLAASLVGFVSLLALMVAAGFLLYSRITPSSGNEVTLRVGYTPEKAALFEALVTDFERTRPRTPDGKPIRIQATRLDPDTMLSQALRGELDVVSPDSSIWLSQLDDAWYAQGNELPLVGETVRYAISPVVIAMWEDVARSLGYPDKALGWGDILARAQSDPQFRWSHPSTASASGLLATLAQFYAGAEKTRGLSEEDVTAPATLNYVGALERTVRYYGEGEWAIIEQVLSRGREYLDAFVAQEQLVIYFNQHSRDKLVAIYPIEGTMWEDHPLALLEKPGVTIGQRQAFRVLSSFLLSHDVQMRILSFGYRPTDLTIALDDPSSPITAANGVDPTQPQTTLQVPSPAVVQVVRDAWYYTKRKTNVYLVADVSGSMEGEKLAQAKEGLLVFLDQIRGPEERVGLIKFSSEVTHLLLLDEMRRNRAALVEQVQALEAGGDTALLDAVEFAYSQLQMLGDSERINAIVVMTDGKENNSRWTLPRLVDKMRRGNQSGVPVVVFCIAYGDDADMATLQEIAEATGGQARRGDPETIGQLYKILSTYF